MVFVIFNSIVIAAVAGAGISGVINGIGDEYGVPGIAGIVPPILALVLVLFRALGKQSAPGKKLGVYWFLWPTALALLCRSAFPVAEMQEVYIAILAISALLPALVRQEAVWLVAFGLASLGYSAQVAVEGKVWVEPPQDISFYIELAEFAALAFFAGLIPWLILKKRGEAQEKEFNKTLEEVRDNAMASAMTRARLDQDSSKKGGAAADHAATASVNANTIRMDPGASATDTFALQSIGGDEENSKLRAMLAFVRYNLKGVAATAFLYDAPRRMLVLNCYDVDVRGGVQLKEGAQIPFGAGVIGQVAQDKMMFMSGDLSLYQNRSEHSHYAQGGEKVSSILAAPIVADSGNKELLGILAVESANKNAFNERDHEVMKKFSGIAAALIVNIRLNRTLERDATMFSVYYEVSKQFSVARKPEDIFAVLMKEIPLIVPACLRQIVVLHDAEKNALRLKHIAGAAGELAEGIEFSPASGGIYAYAFNNFIKKDDTVNLVKIPDMQAQNAYRFDPREPAAQSTRALLVMPIVVAENNKNKKCIGLFSIESSIPGIFGKDLEQQLVTIIQNASVTIERAELYVKMEKHATTDGLTGLMNHRTFQENIAREFERARRYGHPLSLLLTDIDHFKSFNDTYGHPVGDLVLREIAGCLRSAVRINDFPARYGGEEFTVILPETDEKGAYIAAEKIRQAVEARVIDSGPNKLRVTISIGVATFPKYGATQQELIDCADKALYASKKGGRNRVSIYNPGMTVASK